MAVRSKTAVVGVALIALACCAPAQAVFPGQNGKIAFSRVANNDHDIWLMNADGSGQVEIANPSAYDQAPAWSPDGARIAFTQKAFPSDSEVYVMNADGTGRVNLTQSPSTEDSGPSWSPDGTKIAFGDVSAIFTMNADGTQRTQLTHGEVNAVFDPAWSPDGTKIAFWGEDRENQSPVGQVYVMDADGTDIVQLTHGLGSAYWPSWSPDGTKLVYSKDQEIPDSGGFTCCAEIYSIDANGTNETRLTHVSDPANGTGGNGNPTFSPDGTKIAFSSCCRDGFANDNIYVMNPDGSAQTRITTSGDDAEPDWQRIENRSPVCSGVAASRPVLTTINRRLVPITLDGASDPDGDSVTVSVDGVTQDEPVTGRADATSPDAVDEGDGELRVRAERDPRGDGRVYRIAFTAADGRGGSCSGVAKVSVPRKRHKAAVDSAPPSYDSFAR
jgi:dipeptidyl aminopeptidase/acylaminoacyl peptidase